MHKSKIGFFLNSFLFLWGFLAFFWGFLIFFSGPAWSAYLSNCYGFNTMNLNFGAHDFSSGQEKSAVTALPVSITCLQSTAVPPCLSFVDSDMHCEIYEQPAKPDFIRACLSTNIYGYNPPLELKTNYSQTPIPYQLYLDAEHTIPITDDFSVEGHIDIPFDYGVLEFGSIYGKIPSTLLDVPPLHFHDNQLFTFKYATYNVGETPPDCSASQEFMIVYSYLRSFVQSLPTCQITFVDHLNFGDHADLSEYKDANGSIGLKCSPGLTYSLLLGKGLHYFDGSRHLMEESSGEMLDYALYSNPSLNSLWPDGGISSEGIGSVIQEEIYGRVHARTEATVGTYKDSVVVTLVY